MLVHKIWTLTLRRCYLLVVHASPAYLGQTERNLQGGYVVALFCIVCLIFVNIFLAVKYTCFVNLAPFELL